VGVIRESQPEPHDDLVTYLDALKDASDFQRRIIHAMHTMRGAERAEISNYLDAIYTKTR
jgi:hypothetical protein